MQIIPLQPAPSQITRIVLGGQNCQINVYQKTQGLFFDLSIEDKDIVVGTICRNWTPLISREYTGFVGNLLFLDINGSDDPYYTGFGTRFQLVYFTAEEYALV